jgi:hypothetical protein
MRKPFLSNAIGSHHVALIGSNLREDAPMKDMASLAYKAADPLISPAVAAEELGISIDTLRRAWRRRDIQVFQISPRRLGIRRSEINRYLSERIAK